MLAILGFVSAFGGAGLSGLISVAFGTDLGNSSEEVSCFSAKIPDFLFAFFLLNSSIHDGLESELLLEGLVGITCIAPTGLFNGVSKTLVLFDTSSVSTTFSVCSAALCNSLEDSLTSGSFVRSSGIYIGTD